MSLILSIETATKLCSVALARNGAVLALCEEESEKHIHAEKLNVFIAQVMAEAECDLRALDAVAVGIGPGSYTGSRIGLSAAKGLCFALDLPIIGISTLYTLFERAKAMGVLPQNSTDTFHPMVDARRMEVFAQAFNAERVPIGEMAPLILDEAWAAQEGVKRIVFGDGADKATALWKDQPTILHIPGVRPSAGAMAREAERRFKANAFDDLAYLVPAYGKAANVTQSKKLGSASGL